MRIKSGLDSKNENEAIFYLDRIRAGKLEPQWTYISKTNKGWFKEWRVPAFSPFSMGLKFENGVYTLDWNFKEIKGQFQGKDLENLLVERYLFALNILGMITEKEYKNYL